MKYLLGLLLSASAMAAGLPVPPPTPIAIPTPIVISTPTVTYDKVWIQNLQISAPSPTQDASVTATLVPFVSATGAMAPISMNMYVQIPNLLTRVNSGDKQAAQIMGLILNYLSAEAKRDGLLK